MESSNESSSFMGPPSFDVDNYQAWSVKMKVHLIGAGLWEAIQDDPEPHLPNNLSAAQAKAHKEKVMRCAKALSYVYSAVSPTIFTKIMKLKNAKEVWEFLKSAYKRDERIMNIRVMNMMREFERQQMDESESVNEYVGRLTEIIDKVRVLGTEVDK